MRWLKGMISVGLLLAAAAVALVTGLSDHSGDYGKVPLPQGGILHLPAGKVTIFYSQAGDADLTRLAGTQFAVAVTSPSGMPVPMASANGTPGASAVERSETIGELGAIGKLNVPSSGEYVIHASANIPPGTASLEFGTNAGAALAAKWKLLAGLVIGAILIALIPLPRPRRRWEDETGAPTGWSSNPRSPYAG
jgi:hypothetical protein